MIKALFLTAMLVLHLAAPFEASAQSARKISGRVAAAEGATPNVEVPGLTAAPAARGNSVRLSGAPEEGVSDRVVSIGPDGSFEFQGVAPGTYHLTVLPEVSIPPLAILVADRDVVGVSLGATRLRVAGHIGIEGGGVPPRLQIAFEDTHDPSLIAVFIEAGAGFVAELPVGEYRMTISGLPAGYSLKGIAADFRDLRGEPFRVGPERAPSIEVTLGVSSPLPWVRVRGRVEGRAEDVKKITFVTLSGPAIVGALGTKVNPDGSFDFVGVLPGRYEARTVPAPVSLPTTVEVGTTEIVNLRIAAPNSSNFAGEFVSIPPGEFLMGCSPGDASCAANEKPAHRVVISRAFAIGRYEVTQAQWEAVMGANPSQYKGPDRPVENINRWEDAEEFCRRLNAFDDGYRYRLPTEAEWEYAARAGTTDPWTGEGGLNTQNLGSQTHTVGKTQPNAWGLYDMLGNVWEWVADWYDADYYAKSPTLDPQGPASGSIHVARGGPTMFQTIGDHQLEIRVSYRGNRPYPGNNSYVLGFRIVRERIP